MADIRGRFINTAMWRDDWFLGLRDSEQHLFMYLLTGPASSISGVYQLGLAEASFHTKIGITEIKAIFAERFQPDRKAFFEIGWVVLPNFLKHQQFNPNMWTAAMRNLNDAPEWLRKRIFSPDDGMFVDVETVSKGSLMVPKGSLTIANGKTKGIEGNKKGIRREGEKKGEGTPPNGGSAGAPLFDPNSFGKE